MSDNKSHFTLYNKPPLLQFVIALLIIMTIGMALLTAMILGGVLLSGSDMSSLSDSFINESGQKNIGLLRYLMIVQDVTLFIVPAIMIRKLLLPPSQKNLNDLRFPGRNEIALVVLLAFCIFPLTSITGQLNAEMTLPQWLSGVENWMKTKEDDASQIFELLLPAKTVGGMAFNLLIIAVMPAISEELIFRGVFQRIFYGFFKSGHPAIWLTAVIFSAIHIQFYGFVPRLILGLAFGYLFYWGGTLWLPVIAHFVNNAVPVISSFIQRSGDVAVQPEMSLGKQILLLPVPIIICTLIFLYIRNKNRKGSGSDQSQMSGI